MTGHIRIVNDPVELVPLLVCFNNANYKKIYDMLNKNWTTEQELAVAANGNCIGECLAILKKGNLIEEQWRMPKPGEKPSKEYKTTYSKFRANFQCSMSDLSDLLHISISSDETLRGLVDDVINEVVAGSTSINDLARKFNVSPVFIKGLAKRMPQLDVRGQGLVLLDGTTR
ncbi:MAG: ArsR family transcriptional regulator [Methanomicrobiales archaeon]|nr:ArsR family transcriptional regulator [Methanomicrobiales archaeon]